ncbi:MAG TPA: pitrilysin family protein [Terriglobales bacterium]|nr:pitrilysin family protein [Terriglobales bacterium]
MRKTLIQFTLSLSLLLIVPLAFAQQKPAPSFKVPTAMHKLKNGLTVVVSEDHSAPTFGVCVSYGIGFRLEPEGRTGFAHLFEHMMFEGTPVAPKGVFDQVIEGGGGNNNGDTRYDFTEYIETAPISSLDQILWLEADRMKTLDFSEKNLENQRNVVEEEVRVNVLNSPYALFYAIDLPMKAYDTYPNNHNFYGDFHDLDAAKIEDVKTFYEKYYAPNNAVLAVVGDVKPEEVFAKVDKYFAAIPKRDVPPKPNVEEPPQKAQRTAVQQDKHAKLPAFAIGYRMPERNSPDAIVGAVVGDLLNNGKASLLYQQLVKEDKDAVSVSGGVNWPLGTPFEYNGPTLLAIFAVSPLETKQDTILASIDKVITHLATNGPTPAELSRVVTKMRSDMIDNLEAPIDRASVLSHATLFDGNPDRVNRLPNELANVTPEQVKNFARKYLVATNRTVIERDPAPAAENQKKPEGE